MVPEFNCGIRVNKNVNFQEKLELVYIRYIFLWDLVYLRLSDMTLTNSYLAVGYLTVILLNGGKD